MWGKKSVMTYNFTAAFAIQVAGTVLELIFVCAAGEMDEGGVMVFGGLGGCLALYGFINWI